LSKKYVVIAVCLALFMVAGFPAKVYIQGTSIPYSGSADLIPPVISLPVILCLRKNHATFEISLGICPSAFPLRNKPTQKTQKIH